MKTIGKLLSNERINAATVMALSGTLVVLMAKGDGPISLKRTVSRVLSNPVPRPIPTRAPVSGVSSLRATRLRTAA
jgi:hypothetical protein